MGRGVVDFDAGSLTEDEIGAILKTLPIDLTFVGKDDRVKFFTLTEDRIFTRPKSVIGRPVQKCHPQKSVHIVNKILEDFKNGTRDSANFWINLKGKFIYIRYFAVRNAGGEYLGTLEVTQDISNIKELKGEKRIYDEEN